LHKLQRQAKEKEIAADALDNRRFYFL